MPDREAQIDALYAEPLTSFVTARKALAKRLREEGDRDGAKAVAGLKKPSLTAWVLNQLVRTERESVDALLASLDRQRDLQLGALDGSLDPRELAAERGEERRHTVALAAAAERILVEGGQAASKSNIDRATKALRAVALQPESRELLLGGRLIDDEPPGGFEAAAEQLDPALLLAALSAKPDEKKRKPKPAQDGLFARSARSTRKSSVRESSAAGAEEAEQEEARRRAEDRARERERKARQAETAAKLAALRREREERQAAVDAARAEAESLQKQVDAARAEARKQKRQLAELDERIRRLERQI